jgi:hypothetical protein
MFVNMVLMILWFDCPHMHASLLHHDHTCLQRAGPRRTPCVFYHFQSNYYRYACPRKPYESCPAMILFDWLDGWQRCWLNTRFTSTRRHSTTGRLALCATSRNCFLPTQSTGSSQPKKCMYLCMLHFGYQYHVLLCLTRSWIFYLPPCSSALALITFTSTALARHSTSL